MWGQCEVASVIGGDSDSDSDSVSAHSEVGHLRQFFGFEPDDDQVNDVLLLGVVFGIGLGGGHEHLDIMELEEEELVPIADDGYVEEIEDEHEPAPGSVNDIDLLPMRFEDIDPVPEDDQEEDEHLDDSISIEHLD